MNISRFRKVVDCALILALLVVMLGAYTRLTDAGLGCPDWPGCYGHLIVQPEPQDVMLSVTQAQYHFVGVETRKAWTEMVHRYAAGTLALLIFLMGIHAIKQRMLAKQKVDSKRVAQDFSGPFPIFFPVLLMGLVVFQALLGMWTVTLKLLPIVVMAHLLGGILIFSCLCGFRWQLRNAAKNTSAQSIGKGWCVAIAIAVLIVFFQVALGGWVSANYAGIACVGFPRCNGQWLPTLHFTEGFNLFSPVGQNYQGGVLENSVRVTIQTIHRLGALLTVSYLVILSLLLLKKVRDSITRLLIIAIVLVAFMQFGLGIVNVIFRLPLTAAVLHNGFAALLMALVLLLLCSICTGKRVA